MRYITVNNRYLLFLIIIELPGFEQSMELDSWVDNADEAYQHHEIRGKEVDNEFKGILKIKGAKEGHDTEYEKKKREHSYQYISSPPEA
jgi:hypothetical protein